MTGAGAVGANLLVGGNVAARALSQSRLRRDGVLAHAQWKLGSGEHCHYGQALVERAAKPGQALRAPATGYPRLRAA